MTSTRRIGVYPGSFNPPTIAHLGIARAAKEQRNLDRVVWMISDRTLGKLDADHGASSDRLVVLHDAIADVPWLRADSTHLQLLSDIAEPYDVCILGADKWHQINELRWYDDAADRTRQLARLPELAIAPRVGFDIPAQHALDVDPSLADVSSSAARAGAVDLILPGARERWELS